MTEQRSHQEKQLKKTVLITVYCNKCGRESDRTVPFYDVTLYTNGTSQEIVEQHVCAQVGAHLGRCACGGKLCVSEAEKQGTVEQLRRRK